MSYHYERKLALVDYFLPIKFDYGIILHVHEDHQRREGGRSERDAPLKIPLKASIVPVEHNLMMDMEGEYSAGYSEIYIDVDELYSDYGLTIDTEKDYIEYDGKLYKLIKLGEYEIYTNVAIYVMAKTIGDFDVD